jgi:hypothetical protein
MYESNILFSIGYGRKVLTKSGVGISRKCCFPHGHKDGTNLSECVFEALLKGVSTRFRLQAVENCFENAFGKVHYVPHQKERA